jgi:ABC-type antimicrobial peptide transport system permease subunit
MAIQRTKEVGIRKVVGATERSIIYIFSKEFIILVAIAFVIASPLAGYLMQQWLQGYVYRITLSWQVFVIGGAASLIIALATISFHAVKAAIANPVKSLRSE